ncbi:hypothetical protein MTR_0082s0100 [Medicago truncatula]|uniref:Uncharacterized protein n=1 Tax=Medicago truncatula TaxID=3880 RepID=A0A072TI32_MEDTR|nr:hypothetical protein MTR_0082s0100 [Medicago truncatula]
MSTYVRLVDQTIRYTTPRIIPSFYRGEIKKKKRDSDRAADGQASSCRNGVGRQRLLPRRQLEGAEVRRRAFWFLIYSSTEQHPTAPVLLVGLLRWIPMKHSGTRRFNRTTNSYVVQGNKRSASTISSISNLNIRIAVHLIFIPGIVVQSVRAPPCQGGSCGFEPRQSRPRIR